MPASLARSVAIGWIAIVPAIAFILIVAYGLRVFNGMPVFDDWAFIDHLRRTLAGEVSWVETTFARHNGHPSVPARLAFFAAHDFARLDLTVVRWMSVTANVGCAMLAAVVMARAARREDGARFWTADVMHPAMLVGLPLATALFLSNGHWDIYAYAMCFSNVVVNLVALGAMLALDASLEARGRVSGWVWLGVCVLLGALATLSMLQGMLVWVALAAMLAVRMDRRRWLVRIAAFVLVFIAAAVWNYSAVAVVVDDIAVDWTRVLAAPFVLLGTPIFGFIRNMSIHELDGMAGAFAAAVFAFALWRYARSDETTRRRGAPFVALLVFGAGSIVMVAWGRQMFPLPIIAAARYAETALPAVIGGLGLLCVVCLPSNVTRHVLTAFVTMLGIGWLLTNQQEWFTAPLRAAYTQSMMAKARDATVERTPDYLSESFTLDPYYTMLAGQILPWMEEEKLSLFAPAE